MLTEHDLLQSVRSFLVGRSTETELARVAHEAIADHVAEIETSVGRLAVVLASLCSERYDRVLSASQFRGELRVLLGPQLVQAHANLPIPPASTSVATGTSAALTELEYRAPAAE